VGGLYICDNVLWSSYVVVSSSEEDPHAEWTEAIREHNRLFTQDERYLSAIVPTRDGRVPLLANDTTIALLPVRIRGRPATVPNQMALVMHLQAG
jgi:predicted O-methyltransferase YrrM